MLDEESDDTEDEEEAEEEETFVTIGGEEAPASEETSAPEWVKELRKTNREAQKKIKELESKLSEPVEQNKNVSLGAKPTLEGHDYDSDKYEQALDEWYVKKREYDAKQEQARQEEESKAKEWQSKLESYAEKKNSLKFKDYEEAENTVLETLSETQQGMILQGADDPALLVYALGKNPKRAKELADIKDPVKFAFAVAKLETTVKTSSRKKAPPAEKTVTGSASGSANDSTLERLRAEAAKTGNYSKVLAYKAKKKK